MVAGGRTLQVEMSITEPEPGQDECGDSSVEDVLRHVPIHSPYGTDVIDDLTQEEAEAFLDAVRS